MKHLTPQPPALMPMQQVFSNSFKIIIILVGLWLQAGDPSVYLYHLLLVSNHCHIHCKVFKIKVSLKCRGIPSLLKDQLVNLGMVSGVKGRLRVTKLRMLKKLRKSLMPDSCNFVLKSNKLSINFLAPPLSVHGLKQGRRKRSGHSLTTFQARFGKDHR